MNIQAITDYSLASDLQDFKQRWNERVPPERSGMASITSTYIYIYCTYKFFTGFHALMLFAAVFGLVGSLLVFLLIPSVRDKI